MKKFFLIMSVVFLTFVSCASDKKVYSIEKAPKILDAGFSKVFKNEKVVSLKSVAAGETVYMYVAVKDSEFDAEKLIVTAKHEGMEDDGQTIYFNRNGGEQFYYAVEVSFKEKGLWDFDFEVYDKSGKKSNCFRTDLMVE